MLPALTALIALQDLDIKAEEARRRIAEAPVRVAALDARLSGATEALERAKAALAASQAARRQLESEASVAQQRVSKYKDQLMEAKDNRQFHALQHEIATFSAEQSRIEEQVIARMLEGDELGAAVKAAEATLAGDKKSVAAEKSAIEADAIAVKSALDALTAERSALVKTIEPSALATFERVAKGRNGIGLARAVDGLCGACRVRIRPHLYNEVRKGDQIIQCESCVRILYYVPPPKPAEGETPATPTADPPAQS